MRNTNRALTLTLVAGCVASLMFVGIGIASTPRPSSGGGVARFKDISSKLSKGEIRIDSTNLWGPNAVRLPSELRSLPVDPVHRFASNLKANSTRLQISYPDDSCIQSKVVDFDVLNERVTVNERNSTSSFTAIDDVVYFDDNRRCDDLVALGRGAMLTTDDRVSDVLLAFGRALEPATRNHWETDPDGAQRFTAHTGALSATIDDDSLTLEFSTGVTYRFDTRRKSEDRLEKPVWAAEALEVMGATNWEVSRKDLSDESWILRSFDIYKSGNAPTPTSSHCAGPAYATSETIATERERDRFLCQVNLADIAQLPGRRHPDLPTKGMLQFFSPIQVTGRGTVRYVADVSAARHDPAASRVLGRAKLVLDGHPSSPWFEEQFGLEFAPVDIVVGDYQTLLTDVDRSRDAQFVETEILESLAKSGVEIVRPNEQRFSKGKFAAGVSIGNGGSPPGFRELFRISDEVGYHYFHIRPEDLRALNFAEVDSGWTD